MYYYKVLDSKTKELICAATSANMAKFSKKHQIFVLCDEEEGQYLIVQDHVFISKQMRAAYAPHRNKYRWVDLQLISEDDWKKIKGMTIDSKFK